MATETAILPETEWLAEVVRNIERPLVRYALSLTRDYDRARVAVQETFVELWRNSSTVDRSRPAPWLFAVCRARTVGSVTHETREREQEVVRLKFQEGFSYQEIADVTGHSVGHVGVMIHKAILRASQSARAIGKGAPR